MPIPQNIRLGPLAQVVAQDARWEDDYPACQVYADELEVLCQFLQQEGQFERHLPRFRARKKERNSALNEIRIALHFRASGLSVVEWEPTGQKGTTGEFSIGCTPGQRIFVEVKSPTWEAELSQEERSGGRTQQPKYLNGEGRAFDNSDWIRFAVDKAYPKFSPDYPNLLVIADDLFVSLCHGTDMFAGKALYDKKHNGYFTRTEYVNLGGVAVFWEEIQGASVSYTLLLYVNPKPLESAELPDEFVLKFHGQTL